MAAAFAAEGATVAVVDRPGSAGQAATAAVNHAAGRDRAVFLPCDLADLPGTAEVMGSFADAHGGVDVLVNNAAVYPSKPAEQYSIEEWQWVERVNLDAAFVCARSLLPAMRAAGFGRIVNVSSIAFLAGSANLAPYVASKGALVGLTRALAREWGAHGVTVNAVAPGAFPTAAEFIHPDPDGYNSFVLAQQAVKRRGRPEDVAGAVLFLSAPETSFITGQLLCVDGGWVMH